MINYGIIKLVHIDTSLNEADIMTKPLARPTFEKHARTLLNIQSKIAGLVHNIHDNSDGITSCDSFRGLDFQYPSYQI